MLKSKHRSPMSKGFQGRVAMQSTAPLTPTPDSCLVHFPSLKIISYPLFVTDSNLSFGPSPQLRHVSTSQLKGWPPLPDFCLTPRLVDAVQTLCHALVTIHLLFHVANFLT